MPTLEHEGLETRRIVLVRSSRKNKLEVLLGSDGSFRTLPQVDTSPGQRAAEQLAAAVKETCGIEVVSLFSLESSSQPIVYEIMEPHGATGATPRDHDWLAVDALVESEFQDRDDFQGVMRAVAQSNASAEGTFRGPFSRLGWFEDLKHWVEQSIKPYDLRLNGRFRQINARPTFSLIRFETSGPAVWFKAVGEPNLREYPVTLALARFSSQYLPSLIAARPEWNGWLAFEAEGILLVDDSEPVAWTIAARDLAELQIGSLGGSLHLLEAGARDLRTGALKERISPFFGAMDDLMRRQINVPPNPLSHKELKELSEQLSNAIDVLDGAEIPSALGHLDLNPENLVITPNGTVFLDWAEAFVGHPFLSFQYLVEHFRRAFGEDRTRGIRQLLACYISPWSRFFSGTAIHRSLDVAPLVAIFAFATADELWTDPGRLNAPGIGKYLRSLTRRMLREASLLSERSISCPD